MRPSDLLTIFHNISFPCCAMLIYRIRTYEHEAMWGKALTSYDLHTTLPEVTRQVGIVEVKRMEAAWEWCVSLQSEAGAMESVHQTCTLFTIALTGPAELWLEQHPRHLHEGSGKWRGGVGSWAERASLPGRLEEHTLGLWAFREVRPGGCQHSAKALTKL